MLNRFFECIHSNKNTSGQKGFALVFALVMLVVITLLGVWALNTAIVENMIAGNEQLFEQSLNISEGGVMTESGKVGYSSVPWYMITNPNVFNQKLVPPIGSANYDPGGDILPANIPASLALVLPEDSTKWPMGNLAGKYTVGDTVMDYSYLVTYLYWDTPPKGYSPSDFSGYKFRMNSHRNTDIEVGGVKVGVKGSI